jgi:nitric oxide reductase NorE protein
MPLPSERRVPGEPGIWVLILGELFVFSIFFVTIATVRHSNPELYRRAQATLDWPLGLANTLLLLTGSLLVALAVGRARDRRGGAGTLLYGAIACGCGFIALKAIEYSEKIRAGINFSSSEFFNLYFAFTGIHLAHVLIGLVVLWLLRRAVRLPPTPERGRMIECGAIFWHLVDLLWIVLFALFYLVH